MGKKEMVSVVRVAVRLDIGERVVVVVVGILFRIADQTGRFAQYYDGDIIREVDSKEMKCLVHVVYHQ